MSWPTPSPRDALPHELLDVTEAEFERDRPTLGQPDALPASQATLVGELSAAALPQALAELSDLLASWAASPRRTVDSLLGAIPADATHAEVADKAQFLPLLGDAQACQRPGATGDLARQPWRVEWSANFLALEPPTLAGVSAGQLILVQTTEKARKPWAKPPC